MKTRKVNTQRIFLKAASWACIVILAAASTLYAGFPPPPGHPPGHPPGPRPGPRPGPVFRPHHPVPPLRVLPPGFETVVIAGLTYFLAGGIYYRHTPQGYVVVENPVPAPPPDQVIPPEAQIVIVNVYTLNVRSGPGINNMIIHQVSEGDRLVVQGSAPGWYYVRIPDGTLGWVSARYIRLLPPAAQG